MKAILQKVLETIKPDAQLRRKTMKEVEVFLKKINKSLKGKAKAKLGGSFAKNTWLKGDYDVDVFAVFKKADSEALEKALQPFHPKRIRGSRDYFEIHNNIKYEIVPVQTKKENTPDYSLAHVAWVNKQGYHDDIRLAKKFCKAIGIYGSESYRRGISGHVLDILVIHYKGFSRWVKAVAKWKYKTVIDHNKAYKGRSLEIMNTSKTQGPLIVVDPLQKERNAAAALSYDNFDKLVRHAKNFVKHPKLCFFEEQPPDLKKMKGVVITITFVPKGSKEDVARTKIVKVMNYIKQKAREYGVKKTGIIWQDKPKGWLQFTKAKLPAFEEQQGPPLEMKEHVKAFKKRKKTYIKKGRVFAKVRRKNTTPLEMVQQLIKQDYVKERVRSAKCGKESH